MTSISADPTRSRPRTRTPSAFRPHVVGAVFSRDFLGYFSNPAGYVFITLFVLVCSWAAFWQPAFFARNLADLGPLNEWMPYLLLVFVPAITMSVWAEERRQGTDELLLTLPARDVEVVLGKYLAALGIFVVALLFLAVGHVPLLMSLGRPDYGILASTYLGYALMGALLIAIGMVASAISTGATVAYILGAVFCAIPVFASGLGPIGQMLADLPGIGRFFGTTTATATAGSGVARMLDTLSVPSQFRDFGAGVIPLDGLIYFLGLSAAMLYLNMILIGRRHWKGGSASGGRWLHATTRVTAVVVALVSLYLIAGRWANARVDATAERLHTLTDVSRDVIAQIPADRPVYIQAYYSPEVPREYVEVKTNLINTLKEFAALGRGRVLLNLVETRPYTANAREAEQQFGIAARQVSGASGGRQRAAEPIYLGVAFTSGLEQVVVPFFDRGLPVEYEVTRSIRVVSGTARKRVGILETDAQLLVGDEMQRMMGQQSEWEIVAELKKQYDVTPISAESPLPLAEIQTISATSDPTGGTFTLSFEGETTPRLPLNAPTEDVTKALEALKGIGTGRIVLDGGPLSESPINVTFAGPSAGKNVPELVAEAKLEGGEKPTIRVGTTQQVLDVLVVAQPSSLTQPEIDNLRDYVRGGGPTLLLTDPFPAVSPMIAPSEPKPPSQAAFRGMPTPEKGDLVPAPHPPRRLVALEPDRLGQLQPPPGVAVPRGIRLRRQGGRRRQAVRRRPHVLRARRGPPPLRRPVPESHRRGVEPGIHPAPSDREPGRHAHVRRPDRAKPVRRAALPHLTPALPERRIRDLGRPGPGDGPRASRPRDAERPETPHLPRSRARRRFTPSWWPTSTSSPTPSSTFAAAPPSPTIASTSTTSRSSSTASTAWRATSRS